MYNLKCSICGEDFISQCLTAKYCSVPCRYISENKLTIEHLRVCLNCNKKFAKIDINILFCSKSCEDKYNKLMNLYECTCKQCNKSFKSTRKNTPFCSNDCKKLYNSICKECLNCGNEFLTANIVYDFCSFKCKREYKDKYNKQYRLDKTSGNLKIKKYNMYGTSKGERSLYNLVTYLFHDYEVLYNERYDWLSNPETSYPLQLDIYIPKLQLAFEYDGTQHKEYNNFMFGSKKEFLELQQRDQFKDIKCKELGITLIRFDDNKDYVLIGTLKYKLKDNHRQDVIEILRI